VQVYVINEWFWADLGGENGLQQQRETFEFLTRFAKSTLQMLVVEGSSFDQKAWALCSSNAGVLTVIGKAFVTEIRLNSDRCRMLRPDELASLPESLFSRVKPDDRYLAQTCLTISGAVLATTDAPLFKAAAAHGITCITREEMLKRCVGAAELSADS
jgi:hypothetical protein